MSFILPGSTIGILGGGQLGRMTAMAARSLGYKVWAMDPDPDCPARHVVDVCLQGSWDDPAVAAELARGCDVVTLEIEQISLAALEAAEKYAPVRPGSQLLGIVQDRIRQKNWLRDAGFPIGPYRAIRSAADLEEACRQLGGRIFLKSAHGGYDGRSQTRLDVALDSGNAEYFRQRSAEAWDSLGSARCIAEQALELEREISVLVARSPNGEVRAFPPATNHHEHQILSWSVLPSSLPERLESRAREIAIALAEQLELQGVLTVEMFLAMNGELYVNELAPRPHNSYHASERACVTSQFEQAVRAVCGLPLGETAIVRPAAIANLLGELWFENGRERKPHFERALTVPEVRLHLYEKHTARKGRKMGHLSATAATPEEAVARVLQAKSYL